MELAIVIALVVFDIALTITFGVQLVNYLRGRQR